MEGKAASRVAAGWSISGRMLSSSGNGQLGHTGATSIRTFLDRACSRAIVAVSKMAAGRGLAVQLDVHVNNVALDYHSSEVISRAPHAVESPS